MSLEDACIGRWRWLWLKEPWLPNVTAPQTRETLRRLCHTKCIASRHACVTLPNSDKWTDATNNLGFFAIPNPTCKSRGKYRVHYIILEKWLQNITSNVRYKITPAPTWQAPPLAAEMADLIPFRQWDISRLTHSKWSPFLSWKTGRMAAEWKGRLLSIEWMVSIEVSKTNIDEEG